MRKKAAILRFEGCLVDGFFCDAIAEIREDVGLTSDQIRAILFGQKTSVHSVYKNMAKIRFIEKIDEASPVKGAKEALKEMEVNNIDLFASSGLPIFYISRKINSHDFFEHSFVQSFGAEDGGPLEHIDNVRSMQEYDDIFYISNKAYPFRGSSVARVIFLNGGKEIRSHNADIVVNGPLTRIVVTDHIIKTT